MTNICNLCKGMGNLFCVQERNFEWYTCQACDGNGARGQFGPAEIKLNNPQNKFIRPIKEKNNV